MMVDVASTDSKKVLEGKEIGFGSEIFNEIQKRKKTYRYDEDKQEFKCPKCGSVIQQTTAYVSLWFKGLMGGSGRVEHYPFPYCPKCEGEPEIVRGHRYV